MRNHYLYTIIYLEIHVHATYISLNTMIMRVPYWRANAGFLKISPDVIRVQSMMAELFFFLEERQFVSFVLHKLSSCWYDSNTI